MSKKYEYKKYYVAFLDILGFKNIIKNQTCNEVHELFKTIKKPNVSINDEENELFDNSKVNFKIMSDSIIIYVEENIPNAILGLICNCIGFQAELLALKNPILLRGGIAYGDLYFENNNDIIYGPALTDAYLLEEQNAKYPRIIINKSTIPEFDRYIYQVTYRDNDGFYVIDCYNLLKAMASQENKLIANINKHIKNILDSTVDSSIREKYLYLEKQMQRIDLGEKDVWKFNSNYFQSMGNV